MCQRRRRWADLNLDGEAGGDPLAGIFGLLGGVEQLFTNFNVELFADAWYENQIITQDLQNFDPFGFLFGLLFAGPGSLLPIVDEIPTKATEKERIQAPLKTV